MWDLVGNPEDRFSHNEAPICLTVENTISPDFVRQLLSPMGAVRSGFTLFALPYLSKNI